VRKGLRSQDLLEALPEAVAELLLRVGRVATEQGVALFLVGGPVRDLLLERPVVDVDVVVDGDPGPLAEAVAADVGRDALQVVAHDRFGTLRIESGEARLDVARMRHEQYDHPGALPRVEPGSLEQDVRRRDFSINALVARLDLAAPDATLDVIDLEGGLEDLARRRLRILHERSFHDDPTRIWRAARLGARLGFALDRRSRGALRDALRDGAFGAVSGERWRRELQLGFEEAHRGVHVGRVLRSLSDWHVLSALEPGLTLAPDRMVPLRRLSRAIARPDWAAPRWRPWLSGLAIWLAPLPAALRRRTLERFSIRGEQGARVVRFGRDAERTLRSLARARGRGAVDVILAELPEETVQALYALADASLRRRILRWGAEDRRRRAPVGGTDLAGLGLQGPEIGRALARIRQGFLDGEIANREEALALAEELARRASRRRRPTSSGRGRRRGVAANRPITDTSDDGA
jgi:tRNA nucleotidyltransferase (CCA-adding enzyme)